MYDFAAQRRLPVYPEGTEEAHDHLTLPPVKVVGAVEPEPQFAVDARFAESFEMLGYDLAAPAEGIRPGSSLAVTLYFRSRTPTERNYTRFLHLYSGELGMAAQSDSPPQNGGNPTWSWVAGEVIVDQVMLQIEPAAQAGVYALNTGFYDPEENAARVQPVRKSGEAWLDAQVTLQEIRVAP
jgi:hypothetical protein